MIKEWCIRCLGRGHYRSGDEKITECSECGGMGWTPLEPSFSGEAVQIGVTQVYKTTVTQSALWGSTELTKIEVYIKEIKE